MLGLNFLLMHLSMLNKSSNVTLSSLLRHPEIKSKLSYFMHLMKLRKQRWRNWQMENSRLRLCRREFLLWIFWLNIPVSNYHLQLSLRFQRQCVSGSILSLRLLVTSEKGNVP